jgi:hypothetical protein
LVYSPLEEEEAVIGEEEMRDARGSADNLRFLKVSLDTLSFYEVGKAFGNRQEKEWREGVSLFEAS